MMLMYDLQKANLWKRISAFLFDGIMLGIVIVGAALLLSTLFNYDGYTKDLNDLEDHYYEKYNINPDISQEEADALTEEEKEAYRVALEAANKDINQDPELKRLLGALFDLAFLIISLSIPMGFVLLEFVVPLLFKKLKIDPAIATGPFISITNDIIGMLIYMGITVWLS